MGSAAKHTNEYYLDVINQYKRLRDSGGTKDQVIALLTKLDVPFKTLYSAAARLGMSLKKGKTTTTKSSFIKFIPSDTEPVIVEHKGVMIRIPAGNAEALRTVLDVLGEYK